MLCVYVCVCARVGGGGVVGALMRWQGHKTGDKSNHGIDLKVVKVIDPKSVDGWRRKGKKKK